VGSTARPRVVLSALVDEVAKGAPPERLDKLLVGLARQQAQSISRARLQRLIVDGFVLVDGVVVRDVAHIARLGSRIEANLVAPRPLSAAADSRVSLTVVYEDEHLLVVDKPAGLVVHPSKGHPDGTLVNGLVARGAVSADAPEEDAALRPGIVHRLDKGTSGLLVVAKDPTTLASLKELFTRHEIEREYVALVQGEARDMHIDTPHGRHPTDRLRFTSRPRGSSRRAVTDVRVIERLRGATLVACTLETGRTHQIRVHLTEVLGTPIVGDPLYGSKSKDPRVAAVAGKLGHQALHARVLGFVHPALHRPVRWESPLPRDFALALAELREPSRTG